MSRAKFPYIMSAEEAIHVDLLLRTHSCPLCRMIRKKNDKVLYAFREYLEAERNSKEVT